MTLNVNFDAEPFSFLYIFSWVVNWPHAKQSQNLWNWSGIEIYLEFITSYLSYQINPHFWQVVAKSCGIWIIEIYNPFYKQHLGKKKKKIVVLE